MFKPSVSKWLMTMLMLAGCGGAAAQSWNAEQQEVWKVEELQWKMAAAKDASWIEKMVHPNVSFWDSDKPAPQNRGSLQRWTKVQDAAGTVLEQELFPIAITVTGNTAVVQYRYLSSRENYKKERESVSGHYTDMLIRENGRWLFIGWAGGDDPKK